MGFPKSTSLFEFFDVIMTRNTTLQKHTDPKNDHRKGTSNTGDGSEIVPMGHMDESLTPIRIER